MFPHLLSSNGQKLLVHIPLQTHPWMALQVFGRNMTWSFQCYLNFRYQPRFPARFGNKKRSFVKNETMPWRMLLATLGQPSWPIPSDCRVSSWSNGQRWMAQGETVKQRPQRWWLSWAGDRWSESHPWPTMEAAIQGMYARGGIWVEPLTWDHWWTLLFLGGRNAERPAGVIIEKAVTC